MVFRNARDGWVVGSPRGDEPAYFFRTRDEGKNWEPQALEPPQGFSKEYSVLVGTPSFFGNKKAAGVLSATFFHWNSHEAETDFFATRDGGEHWRRAGITPAEMEGNADGGSNREVFVDGEHGWRMNTDGQLFATADGAATWRKVGSDLQLEDDETISQIDFVNPTHGWLIKDIPKEKAEDRYELLQTSDGGHTWTHCFGPESAAAHP